MLSTQKCIYACQRRDVPRDQCAAAIRPHIFIGVVNIDDLALSGRVAINLPAILVANSLGAGLMLVLLLSRHKHANFASLDGRLFLCMCHLSMALCVLEMLGFLLDGHTFAGARALNTLTSSLIFILYAVFACLWVCYVEYKLFASVDRLRRICPIAALPAIGICVLSIVNLFCEVFFIIDAANHYLRRPLCILPFALALCYMTYGALVVFRYRKRSERYLFMTILVYVVPVCLGVVIQFLNYGISLVWVATSFGLTSMYVNLQHEDYYVDALTGLYNRRYLYDRIAHLKRRHSHRVTPHVSGVILDINNFKSINDNFGHLEGDAALRTAAKLLLAAVDGAGIVVRYGGDEFVIMLEDASQSVRAQVRNRIAGAFDEFNAGRSRPYQMTLAMGSAELDIADPEEFFTEMDRNMYENKRRYYAESASEARARQQASI